MSGQLVSFLDNWTQNPESILQAVRLSYFLLDFARILVSCRVMVSLTQEEDAEPFISSASDRSAFSVTKTGHNTALISQHSSFVPHPLDSAIKNKELAASNYAKVCKRVGGSSMSEFTMGVEGRIRIADDLQADELLILLRSKREISGRLFHLKEAVLEGLATFLLAQRKPVFCDFICRKAKKTPSSRQDVDGRFDTDDGEKISRDNDKAMLLELIGFLQQLRVRDCLNISEMNKHDKRSEGGLEEDQFRSRQTFFGELETSAKSLQMLRSDMLILESSFSSTVKVSDESTMDERDLLDRRSQTLHRVSLGPTLAEYADLDRMFLTCKQLLTDERNNKKDELTIEENVDLTKAALARNLEACHEIK